MNGETYIRTEKTVEQHREIQSQLRAASEEATRELQAQQARCCCSDWFSRAVAIAQAEENEAAGKGGDVSPLNERETKAFWNGYWAAAHNISHDIEELARENDPSSPTAKPQVGNQDGQMSRSVQRLVRPTDYV